jgi:hypothetical protein
LVNLFEPISKDAAQLREPEIVPEAVRKAFKVAKAERPGCSFIDFPESIAAGEVVGKQPLKVQDPLPPVAPEEKIARAAELVSAARFPPSDGGQWRDPCRGWRGAGTFRGSHRDSRQQDLHGERSHLAPAPQVSGRFPGLSRTELTCTLCEHLDWLTPAGRPKFEACAKLLARMEEAGELRLPRLRKDKSHPGPRSCAPRRASARTDPPVSLVGSLSKIDAVRLRLASDPAEQNLWNEHVERYHPLGYKNPVGFWARYFIESGGHWLGCILLGGAAKALRARDRWIGWNDRQRLANLPWVLNNSLFLIFPGVENDGSPASRLIQRNIRCMGYPATTPILASWIT